MVVLGRGGRFLIGGVPLSGLNLFLNRKKKENQGVHHIGSPCLCLLRVLLGRERNTFNGFKEFHLKNASRQGQKYFLDWLMFSKSLGSRQPPDCVKSLRSSYTGLYPQTGDTTRCGMTGVTLHSHVRYKEI
jgi:hypothetical protein